MSLRALALAAALMLPPVEAAACRLALALGLDVSASVDDREYVLQLAGVADALEHPEVQARLLADPGDPVALAVYEWSAASYQRVLVDWRLLRRPADVAAVAEALRGTGRHVAPESTGIGAALRFGAALLARAPGCLDAKLDLSGDGENNDWPDPRVVARSGALDRITVNALVIGSTDAAQLRALMAYFGAKVIFGPGAFVEPAAGFDAYAEAMVRKLIRELDVPVLGMAEPGQ